MKENRSSDSTYCCGEKPFRRFSEISATCLRYTLDATGLILYRSLRRRTKRT